MTIVSARRDSSRGLLAPTVSTLMIMNRDSAATPAIKRRGRAAAWTLLLLTPFIAELSFATPIQYAYLYLLWIPAYGGGILLIRELVVRAGRGWPSVLILGIAYQVAEDGLGLQALTSPNLYQAAEWGARVAGFNLVYWQVNLILHVVFSAVIPIAVTGMLFPRERNRPYLTTPGLIITAVVAVLGIGILRVVVPPVQDPSYSTPLPIVAGLIALIIALGVVALRVLPPRTDRGPTGVGIPGNWALAAFGFVGTVIVLGMLYPLFGATQPMFTQGWWVLVPMVVAALLLIPIYRLVSRWGHSRSWTDLQLLSLAAGAAVAHSMLGAVLTWNWIDRAGFLGFGLLIGVAAAIWARRMVRQQTTAHPSTPAR